VWWCRWHIRYIGRVPIYLKKAWKLNIIYVPFISVEVELTLFGAIPPRLLADQQLSAYNLVATPFLFASDIRLLVRCSCDWMCQYRTGGPHRLVRCIQEPVQSTNRGRLPNRVPPIVFYDWSARVAISVISISIGRDHVSCRSVWSPVCRYAALHDLSSFDFIGAQPLSLVCDNRTICTNNYWCIRAVLSLSTIHGRSSGGRGKIGRFPLPG